MKRHACGPLVDLFPQHSAVPKPSASVQPRKKPNSWKLEPQKNWWFESDSFPLFLLGALFLSGAAAIRFTELWIWLGKISLTFLERSIDQWPLGWIVSGTQISQTRKGIFFVASCCSEVRPFKNSANGPSSSSNCLLKLSWCEGSILSYSVCDYSGFCHGLWWPACKPVFEMILTCSLGDMSLLTYDSLSKIAWCFMSSTPILQFSCLVSSTSLQEFSSGFDNSVNDVAKRFSNSSVSYNLRWGFSHPRFVGDVVSWSHRSWYVEMDWENSAFDLGKNDTSPAGMISSYLAKPQSRNLHHPVDGSNPAPAEMSIYTYSIHRLVYVCVCMCVYKYVCIYIYIHMKPSKEEILLISTDPGILNHQQYSFSSKWVLAPARFPLQAFQQQLQ